MILTSAWDDIWYRQSRDPFNKNLHKGVGIEHVNTYQKYIFAHLFIQYLFELILVLDNILVVEMMHLLKKNHNLVICYRNKVKPSSYECILSQNPRGQCGRNTGAEKVFYPINFLILKSALKLVTAFFLISMDSKHPLINIWQILWASDTWIHLIPDPVGLNCLKHIQC